MTQIKYNQEGDLLFSCSKDLVINVWFSDNGERLGTYDGHNGTVWTLDVDCASPLASDLLLFTLRPSDEFAAILRTVRNVNVLVISQNEISSIWVRRQYDETLGCVDWEMSIYMGVPYGREASGVQ